MSNSNRNTKPLTTEEFIIRAIKKHGNKYDYSKSIYINSLSKIIITCKLHGDFEQKAANHLTGNGCPYCAGKIQTTEGTVKKLIDARGDRYDYSKVVYTKSNEKVKIICRIHGEFEQNIWQHIHGANCQLCSKESGINKNKLPFSDMLARFEDAHGDRYDYSESEYINIDTPIKIKCKVHGYFFQTPYHHQRNTAGCSLCTKATPYSRTKYIEACNKYDGKSSLYVIQLSGNGELFYKVGITMKTIKQRFGKIPYKIKEIRIVVGDAGYIYDLETQIHRLLSRYHYKPKNSFGGSKMECFSETPKSVLSLIDSINKTSQLQLIA